MHSYKLDGARVQIDTAAEMFRKHFAGGVHPPLYGKHVQEVLDNLAADVKDGEFEWSEKEVNVYTITDFEEQLPLYVLERQPGETVRWGRYAFHTSRMPQVSPFVDRQPDRTTELTLELVGTLERPKLIRAYAGPYVPLLPWQKSLNGSEAKKESRDFWSTHAFSFDRHILKGPLRGDAPNWAS